MWHRSGQMPASYSSAFEKTNCIQCLPYVWDLLFQTQCSPFGIRLHELVFPIDPWISRLPHPYRSEGTRNERDHLLETLKTSFDFCSRLNIILDLVNEWGIWDASWIRWGIFSASIVRAYWSTTESKEGQGAYFVFWTASISPKQPINTDLDVTCQHAL